MLFKPRDIHGKSDPAGSGFQGEAWIWGICKGALTWRYPPCKGISWLPSHGCADKNGCIMLHGWLHLCARLGDAPLVYTNGLLALSMHTCVAPRHFSVSRLRLACIFDVNICATMRALHPKLFQRTLYDFHIHNYFGASTVSVSYSFIKIYFLCSAGQKSASDLAHHFR